MTRRITIVGLGAIGGWVGARLALAGHAVSALVRRPGDVATTLIEGERRDAVRIAAAVDAADLGEQDVVIVAVKAPSLADAAEAARPLIGASTLVVPMLNGVPWWFLPGEVLSSVDPDGRIAASIPVEQTIGCVVHAAVSREGGAVTVRRSDGLLLGEPGGGPSARVAALATVLGEAGIAAEAVADVRRAIWYKLWGNMTFNPVSALTLATADRILADPDARAFMLSCMAEAAEIGRRIGCPIEESGEDRLSVTERLGAFRTSMLQDVEAGRRIELEALVGAPPEIARRVGLATPNIDALYGLTRLIAESRGLL